MSTQTLDNFLSRWFHDSEFRQLLRESPEEALADYELSPAHRARLLNVRKYGLPTRELRFTQHDKTAMYSIVNTRLFSLS